MGRQSSHLPTTRAPAGRWWETSKPKEMGGTPKQTGRMWGDWEWRRSGGWTGPAPLRGGWGGGVSMPGGTFGGLDQGRVHWEFPLSNWPGKTAWLSGQVLYPQRPPLGGVGPGSIGGRPGENRRGRWEGPSGTRGAGVEQRAFAQPTQAREACWAPRPGPAPSETRDTPGPLLFHWA